MKQTTREDYELAAKAAGVEIIWAKIRDGIPAPHHQPNKPVLEPWQPLDDDGDSRRLQVACGITLQKLPSGWAAIFVQKTPAFVVEKYDAFYPASGEGQLQAVRHAVFWLAVEIGRAMK